jgi:hypothetical protein
MHCAHFGRPTRLPAAGNDAPLTLSQMPDGGICWANTGVAPDGLRLGKQSITLAV